MKKELINIDWDNVKCHICNTENNDPILLRKKPLVEGQFGYAIHPVICKSCGLIYLNPRWSKEDYNVFYTYYYDKLYRLETKEDYGTSAVIYNIKEIWSRIKDQIKPGKEFNILDVGCGYGYGLKYLQEQVPNATLFGIEASPDSIETLQSKAVGATLVTDDFDSAWENNYEGKMDLIILRHVFEHLLNPIETLNKLRKALKPNGVIYFAVPDMTYVRTNLRDYKYWWEYIFRSVHTYYYNKDTFTKTLEIGQLFPLLIAEEKEEIWCLVGKNKTTPFEFENTFQKQMAVLEKLFPKN